MTNLLARDVAKNPEHTRAIGQLLLAALFWSLGGLLIKSADWPPLAVAGGRGLVAAVFLALTNRPLRFTFSPVQLLAALAYAGCTVLFVVATKLTTAANAILLQYTAPVWIALFGAWFLHERASRTDWLTIFVVLGGMGLFFADGLELASVLGNVTGVLSGVCFAAMTIALRRQKDGSPVESIILGNVIAFLIGLPFMIGAPAPSPTGIAAIIALGVVQLGFSYWLYARAIRHVTALEAVIIPVVEPILNPVWVFLASAEKPSPWALLGGVIVLTAVTLRAFSSIRAGRATV
ncbi:MAG: DMT family transporter [Opitutaceae bacterium]|nr:DMT family transporter [Opitutaceae bacterium]MBP9912913.1 DMT family transporter [Opitutaceae bacterium]